MKYILLENSINVSELPEITTQKIDKKTTGLHPEGLFSKVIFGPEEPYSCGCNKQQILNDVCQNCGVEIIDSSSRRERFARIHLYEFPVFNPLYFEIIKDKKIKKVIKSLFEFKVYLEKVDNEIKPIKILQNEIINIDENSPNIFVGPKGAIKYIYYCLDKGMNIVSNKHSLLFKDREMYEKKFLLNDVLVLPPDLRPRLKTKDTTVTYSEKINQMYLNLITKVQQLRNTIVECTLQSLYFISYADLQQIVNDIYLEEFSVFASKEGLIRKNTLGKRIDFCGRAAIVPDPSLKLDECRISYFILVENFKFHLIHRLMLSRKDKSEHLIKDEIEESIKNGEMKYIDDIEEIIKGRYVLLNRQPTLHKHSMLGFKIKLGKDKVIKINPLVCPGYNADFDGDTMAAYFPLLEESNNEIKEKLISTNNLYFESSGDLAYVPDHDIILGLCEMELNGYTENLPEELIGKCQNKKSIIRALNSIKNKTRLIEVLDQIKYLGFYEATRSGISFSISDFIPYETDLDKIYDSDIGKSVEREKAEIEKLKKFVTPNVYKMVTSGARGNWEQVKRLLMAVGFVTSCSGKILPTPIKKALAAGLNEAEYFLTAYGVRKGLVDISDNTSKSGVLERMLVYNGITIVRDLEMEDCGVTKGLVYPYVKESDLVLLEERYVRVAGSNDEYELLTESLYEKYLGRTIEVRSPIYCNSPELCHKCCPIEKRNIGIISAQIMGERGTQMVLRVFHTSGAVKDVGDDDEAKDISNDLRGVTRMLENPSKIISTQEDIIKFIKLISGFYQNYGKIRNIHFENILSGMLRDKEDNSILWRLTDLEEDPEALNFKKIPKDSWLLGCAASHFKLNLLNGINKECGDSIFEQIILGTL